MNEENIIIAYKINENDRRILEKVSKKTNEPFTIMTTNEPEDILPIPSAFMAFVNIENESNEADKKYVLKNVNDIAEYMNSIVIDENTFKDEETLIKIINKNYKDFYKVTEWDRLEDDYNELMEKIKLYQEAHSLAKGDFSFSELDLIHYFNDELPHVCKCIINSTKREILYNKLLDYIDFNQKHISPISYKNINKGILRMFISSNTLSHYPICFVDEKELEKEENPRALEIKQLAKLCDILAEEIYIGKYDKSIGNTRIEFMVKHKKDKHITDEHLISCRLSKDNVIYVLMQYIQELIIMTFSKEKGTFNKKNLFKYKFNDELWENIRIVIRNFVNLPLWKNRNVFIGTYFAETWKSIFETGKTEEGIQLLEKPIDLMELLKK